MSDAAAILHRAAPGPATWQESDLTCEALVSTFAPVGRRDGRGPYLERLDPDGLEMPTEPVPLLDGHAAFRSRDVVGSVTAFRRTAEGLLATLRLSAAEDAVPVVQRVREGSLRGVSIGYRVTQWRTTTEGERRTLTATRWRIAEVSLVPLPADDRAGVRSHTTPTEEARMAEETTVTNPPATAPSAEELARRGEVRTICRAAGMDDAATDALVDRGATAEEARSAAYDAMLARSAAAPTIRTAAPAQGDPATVRTRREAALHARATGGDMPAEAREYADESLLDMARASLEAAGTATRGLSRDEMLHRAAHGSSDFPLMVSNVAGRVALDAYTAARSPLMALARRRDLRDFKESKAVRLGGMGRLEPLAENGEFTATSRAENGESIRLGTFGRRFDVSRELLINDDLGLLGDVTRALGEAAAQTESDYLVGLLKAPGVLSDGTAVFHADRGNLADGAAGMSIGDAGDDAGLSEARRAMRVVKDLDGETIVGAAPRYLVVGPEHETAAERMLAAIQPHTTADHNPWSSLELLVEPRLGEEAGWWLFADPARLPTITYAHLASAPGVQIQRQESWNTLGLGFRAYLDFGVAWTDWRGAYRNAGTA